MHICFVIQLVLQLNSSKIKKWHPKNELVKFTIQKGFEKINSGIEEKVSVREIKP